MSKAKPAGAAAAKAVTARGAQPAADGDDGGDGGAPDAAAAAAADAAAAAPSVWYVQDASGGVWAADLSPALAARAPVSLVVGDLSFISLRLILPTVRRLLAPDGEAVLLVKPQFEVGRDDVGKNGLVRDEDARARALVEVRDAASACGFSPRADMVSPITGARSGNEERLLQIGPALAGG
jgi:hypothetical protein